MKHHNIHLMSFYNLCRFLVFGLILNSFAHAKILINLEAEKPFEVPRSQIKTYIQRQSLEQSLKPISKARPGSLSNEELLAVPERYLSPELREKQKALKEALKAEKRSEIGSASRPVRPEYSSKVTIRDDKNRLIDIAVEDTLLNRGSDKRLLVPKRLLPDVEKIEELVLEGSQKVQREIEPGDVEEVKILSESNLLNANSKSALKYVFSSYAEKDYAAATILGLGLYANPKSSAEVKEAARYVSGHALFQSGFYESSLVLMSELVTSRLRRSVIGVSAKAIEKTRDDSAANLILSKVALSQIREADRPLFSFHMGRTLLSSGALGAARGAFEKVPETHVRYPEATYYLGVIASNELAESLNLSDWDNEKSSTFRARALYEKALVAARASRSLDLVDLANLSLARLAYQAKQYNRAVFHYSEVSTSSPFAREALFETGWALYRLGEFNRSLGMLHPLGSRYFEGRDISELWILRSLNYLKLCRFDEANRAANTFKEVHKQIMSGLEAALKTSKDKELGADFNLKTLDLPDWVLNILESDPVLIKDQEKYALILLEQKRLGRLRLHERIADKDLREEAARVLEEALAVKAKSLVGVVKPYLIGRVKDIIDSYRSEGQRLDLLRFEIYSQATKFPTALNRPQAKELIKKGEYLPGVYLKGHEILWRYSGEYWNDELTGYDYFIPSECSSLSASL